MGLEWLTLRSHRKVGLFGDEAEVAIKDPDGVTLQNGQWCKDNLFPMVQKYSLGRK